MVISRKFALWSVAILLAGWPSWLAAQSVLPAGNGFQASRSSACQIRAAGPVLQLVGSAWGDNYYGELGNGATITSPPYGTGTPVAVQGIADLSAVAGGLYHSLALTTDGTVWAWGLNGNGQLGNGTTTESSTPVQVSGLAGIVAIAAGGYHNLALRNDGTVWAWGENQQGQLGNGAATDSSTPVQVSGLSNVVAIAAGYFSSLALTSDGYVWAWGDNSYGQLGDGEFTVSTPYTGTVDINGTTVTWVSGSPFVTGTAWNGITINLNGTPYTIASVASTASLTLTANLGVIDNASYTAGATAFGSNIPSKVINISGIVAIASGAYHNLALTSGGMVWAWGNNGQGELGDGTVAYSSPGSAMPVAVIGLSGVATIAGGGYHSLALTGGGTLWAWGDNYFGQLGTGFPMIAPPYGNSTPVAVPDLPSVIAIAGGEFHTLALTSSGTAWAWGYNGFGQLGDGTITDSGAPVPLAGFSGVASIAAGYYHSLLTFPGGNRVQPDCGASRLGPEDALAF